MTNAPSGSYSFWLACFYILVALIVASIGLCVYVAVCFKRGSFPYVWPVKCAHPLETPTPQNSLLCLTHHDNTRSRQT